MNHAESLQSVRAMLTCSETVCLFLASGMGAGPLIMLQCVLATTATL